MGHARRGQPARGSERRVATRAGVLLSRSRLPASRLRSRFRPRVLDLRLDPRRAPAPVPPRRAPAGRAHLRGLRQLAALLHDQVRARLGRRLGLRRQPAPEPHRRLRAVPRRRRGALRAGARPALRLDRALQRAAGDRLVGRDQPGGLPLPAARPAAGRAVPGPQAAGRRARPSRGECFRRLPLSLSLSLSLSSLVFVFLFFRGRKREEPGSPSPAATRRSASTASTGR